MISRRPAKSVALTALPARSVPRISGIVSPIFIVMERLMMSLYILFAAKLVKICVICNNYDYLSNVRRQVIVGIHHKAEFEAIGHEVDAAAD